MVAFLLPNHISIDAMTSTGPSHQCMQPHAIDNSDLERPKTPERNQDQVSDTTTPSTKGTHAMMNAKLEEQRQVLLSELGQPELADDNWIKTLYSHPPTSDLDAFLSGSGLYDKARKKWKCIPRKVDKESRLYRPFLTMLQAILKLHGANDDGVTRVACDTHNKTFYHKEPDDLNTMIYATTPDITIIATGPSFEKPEDGADVGYSNAACVFDVKLNRALGTIEDHIAQLGSYVRCVIPYLLRV